MKKLCAVMIAALLTACGGGNELPDVDAGPPLCAAKQEACA